VGTIFLRILLRMKELRVMTLHHSMIKFEMRANVEN
jgi:hypothetical protein